MPKNIFSGPKTIAKSMWFLIRKFFEIFFQKILENSSNSLRTGTNECTESRGPTQNWWFSHLKCTRYLSNQNTGRPSALSIHKTSKLWIFVVFMFLRCLVLKLIKSPVSWLLIIPEAPETWTGVWVLLDFPYDLLRKSAPGIIKSEETGDFINNGNLCKMGVNWSSVSGVSKLK